MKEKIKTLLKSNKKLYNVFRDIYFYLRTTYIKFFMLIFRVFKIKKNRICVISYYGNGYGDNGKYIVEKLVNLDKNLEIYWAVKNRKISKTLPHYVKPVKFNSIKFLYYLTTSKVWINNTRFLYGTRKRKEQYYIQIWHGNLALKKIEFDAILPKNYVKIMHEDNKNIDLMVSNSEFCTNMYKNSFRYTGETLKFGTPRNDNFINKNEINKSKNKVRETLNIENKSIKILLYAPTFRDNYEHNPYDIDFKKIKQKLEKKYNCEWKILVRFHPLVINGEKLLGKNEYINVTKYPDMQELINTSNLIITDYSSVMFDALIANKPVLLYANDIEKYNQERGYYFKFSQLPFLLSKSNNELCKNIDALDEKSISKKYDTFKQSIKLYENGTASEKLARKILEEISK